MAELPRAAFLPDRTVRVAAALLPAAARERYEREYLSELFGLTTRAQTRYALDVLLHTAHLRAATRRQGTPQELTMTDTPHPPLTCRLHLHHRWVTQRTTDGGHYEQCRRCGKDRNTTTTTPTTTPAPKRPSTTASTGWGFPALDSRRNRRYTNTGSVVGVLRSIRSADRAHWLRERVLTGFRSI